MNLSAIARALSALDFSDEADRLTAIARDINETEAARERGKQKTMQLSQQLATIRDNRRDGKAEAEALRSGEDIAAISRTEETIRGEREAITAGMHKLSADLEHLGKERSAVQDHARAKLAQSFDSLIAEMDAEARQLSTRLAQIYSDAETIRAASRNMGATRLSTALQNVVDETACSNLIARSKPIPASPPLVELLTSNREAVKLAGGSLHTQHRTPRL